MVNDSLSQAKFAEGWYRNLSTFKTLSILRFLAVFRPAGATVYTDQGEVWHGRAHHTFTLAFEMYPQSVNWWVWEPQKFKIRPNLEFLASQGRRDAPMTLKFGTERNITCSPWCAKFHRNQGRSVGKRASDTPKSVEVLVFGPLAVMRSTDPGKSGNFMRKSTTLQRQNFPLIDELWTGG